MICRLYTVSRKEGKFLISEIAVTCQGATTFAAIRRVNDVKCLCFREASKVHGLFVDVPEWVQGL